MAPESGFVQASYFYVGIFLPASVLIPLSIGAYRRVYAQPELRAVFLYLLVAGATNILAKLLGEARLNNLPLLHIYTIVEFLLLLSYYGKILRHPVLGRALGWLSIAFPVAAVLNFLLVQDIFTFNSYPRSVAAVVVVALAVFYFFAEEARKGPHGQANRWINFGLLQYFGSSIFMFAFSNVLYQHASRQGQFIIGLFHATLVLIMYILFSFGFLSLGKRR
ncbi:hypothetical protein LGH70_17850 [Hymenobacter sp. BT635]|uniref:Uncharacterized protein n=1 Tax=Hymenobacter nitidus TaxID=2880929 RepID=A0ABS8AGA4_9BACT|nr:hypothetical protein [Hymenobacter nitidus]MCB2379466.1 hypothetical protein [Hymenobacter nitidus]